MESFAPFFGDAPVIPRPERPVPSEPPPRTIRTQEDTAMAEFPRSLNRSHEYTYRLPTPPRIVVPPPTLTSEMPELNVGIENNPADDLDTSFLKEMNLESIVQRNTLLEWAYERRRQAQMILPWLYLGPLPAAKDKEFLAREGITMALVIRANASSMSGAIEAARSVCQDVASIEAPNYHALIPYFSKATRMINQHIARIRQASLASLASHHQHHQNGTGTEEPRLGKVLVFCESGNEKSAAVVAAYLMEMMGNFDYVQAMQICQAQRFCVNFDDTIKTVLRSHWDILSARRAVAASSREAAAESSSIDGVGDSSMNGIVSSKPKRTIEETNGDEDEDMDMGDGWDPSDALRFGSGRDNTPFRDA